MAPPGLRSWSGDLRPRLAQFEQQAVDTVDPVGIAMDASLVEVAGAEQVYPLQMNGDLASLLHIERATKMVDDRLGAAQLVVRRLNVLAAHRDARLRQKSVRAVIEHHNELLFRCG